MDQRFKDIKKETQDSIAGQGAVSQDQIKDVVREAYKEEKMKESKKPNLVLFNIPEKRQVTGGKEEEMTWTWS